MSQNVLERFLTNLIESKLISIPAFYLEIFFLFSLPKTLKEQVSALKREGKRKTPSMTATMI